MIAVSMTAEEWKKVFWLVKRGATREVELEFEAIRGGGHAPGCVSDMVDTAMEFSKLLPADVTDPPRRETQILPPTSPIEA
jgi:hypothetical protein